jgi:HrpA-like RNA helicase/predicted RNA-binding protein with RPS1 domain
MARQYVTTCKDCSKAFYYSEASYLADRERGYSRPERCLDCRRQRQKEINSGGLGYYPVKIVAEVPPDFVPEPGILGRVHHAVRPHVAEDKPSHADQFEFGITEADIRDLYSALENRQVAVIEGPTGSGKSTYLPYRLMVPPDGVPDPDRFTRNGQIVVTQPRQLATRSIPEFIARDLHGSELGPGSDVGYRHAGNNKTDRRNRLVFITDGTLINWLVNEQIGHFSVIMIDEAHERSVNIDLIFGLLRARLARHPRLKLIIASATIKAGDFVAYFGGPEKVAHLKFRGLEQQVEEHFAVHENVDYESLVKQKARAIDDVISQVVAQQTLEVLQLTADGGPALRGDVLAFLHSENGVDLAVDRIQRLCQKDGRLREVQVFPLYRNLKPDVQKKVLESKSQVIVDRIVQMLKQSPGGTGTPILAWLLDRKMVEKAGSLLRTVLEKQPELGPLELRLVHKENLPAGLVGGPAQTQGRRVTVVSYDAAQALPPPAPDTAIIADWRVIVATNVAETSLTVDGVVHVVDSGLIKQTTYDVDTRTQRLETRCHSQAGCRQRRGRAGRIRPGYAWYLYTQAQFDRFEQFTPPETQRAPLDDLLLAARAAGLVDPAQFDWFQATNGMRRELVQAQAALQQLGAVDAAGDVTEDGLEMRTMTQEPEVASLLLTADGLCCVIEMATLLPLVTLQLSLRGGLYLWNPTWDAQTRWEASRRQQALRLGCADDVEWVLKTVSAWEASGQTDRERRDWAWRFMVNHDVIANQIIPERDQLIKRLAIGTRGDVARPINLDLLERLRMAMALSIPGRIAAAGQVAIAAESVCYGATLPLIVYARRVPFKETGTGQILVRATLVARLDSLWADERPPRDAGWWAQVDWIARHTRVASGALHVTPATRQLELAQYPIESVHSVVVDPDGRARILRRISSPPPLYEQTGQRHGRPEAETEELESEAVQPIRGGTRRSASEGPDTDNELDDEMMASTAQAAQMRVLWVQPDLPQAAVDLYLDGSLEIAGLPAANGQTPRFELPPGDHELLIVPAGDAVEKAASQARIHLRSLEADSEYSIILSSWSAAGPDAYYVMADRDTSGVRGRTWLRWGHVGHFGLKLEVEIGNRDAKPAGYYELDPHRPQRVRVYGRRKNGPERRLLAEETFNLHSAQCQTLVITPGSAVGVPKLTLLAESTNTKAAAALRSGNIAARLAASVRTPISGALQATVIGYALEADTAAAVLLRPRETLTPFAKFAATFHAGDPVTVEPVAVDAYPEQRQYALIVREPTSGLEIAVAADELFFDRWSLPALLAEMAAQPQLSLDVDWIDTRHQRVYLTRLESLAEALQGQLGKAGEIIMPATVLEIVRGPDVTGMAVRLTASKELALGALVWEASLRHTAQRELDSFSPGEAVQVLVKFTGARVKVPRLTKDLLDKARASRAGRELGTSAGGERVLSLTRPMTADELAELLKLADDSHYQWAIVELFRRSNRPRVDLVDVGRLAELDARYPAGKLIAGCRVIAVQDRMLSVETPDGYAGVVTIGEWSNEWLDTLKGAAQTDQVVRLEVLGRSTRGELRLSRKRSALQQYSVGERYTGTVIEVTTDRAVIRLDATENGQVLDPLVGQVGREQWPVILPTGIGQTPKRTPVVGETMSGRVIEIDMKGRLKLAVRHAAEQRLVVPADATRLLGRLIGPQGRNRTELERLTGAEIYIGRQPEADGSQRIAINASSGAAVAAAVEAIRQVIPQVTGR